MKTIITILGLLFAVSLSAQTQKETEVKQIRVIESGKVVKVDKVVPVKGNQMKSTEMKAPNTTVKSQTQISKKVQSTENSKIGNDKEMPNKNIDKKMSPTSPSKTNLKSVHSRSSKQ